MVDTNCSYSKWLFDDAMVSPFGNYKCQANCRGREIGEYGGSGDWYNCDSENHSECNWFKKQFDLENKTKSQK
jgi:hypothetical protein